MSTAGWLCVDVPSLPCGADVAVAVVVVDVVVVDVVVAVAVVDVVVAVVA